MPSPNPSSDCTRQNSSERKDHGGTFDHLEYATLEYVDWFNHRRILEPIGDIPPTEREANYYSQQSPAPLAGLKQTSLR